MWIAWKRSGCLVSSFVVIPGIQNGGPLGTSLRWYDKTANMTLPLNEKKLSVGNALMGIVWGGGVCYSRLMTNADLSVTTGRPTRRMGSLLLGVLGVIALDQLSKYWLLYEVGLKDGPPVVVTDFFRLVMVWNYGISFGMLAGAATPYPLIAIALVISALLTRLALKTPLRVERVGYALIIGGALGNVIDRLRFGAVADFFYFHIGELGWPAFNIADSAIFLGVSCLLITMLRNSKVAS